MRFLSLASTVLMVAFPLAAQNCVFAPDNIATGSCNVIPFGDNSGSTTWTNQKYQMLVPGSSIGTVPYVIRELGFASCGTGQRSFTSLRITLDHTVSGTLSTTFAANLTAAASVVLDVADYSWENLQGAWSPIGLQKPFVFIPALGNLVIDIELQGAKFPLGSGGQGMVRSSTLQRVYAFGWTGSAPASGSTDQAAVKVQICEDLAWATPFGKGCPGGNALVPTLGYPVTPKLGTANFSVDLSQAAATSPAYLLFGVTNAAPNYPIDLTPINMPGCKLYVSPDVAIPFATNTAGAGSVPLPIPNSSAAFGVRVFNQTLVIDPGANGLGIAASNPGWFLVGT